MPSPREHTWETEGRHPTTGPVEADRTSHRQTCPHNPTTPILEHDPSARSREAPQSLATRREAGATSSVPLVLIGMMPCVCMTDGVSTVGPREEPRRGPTRSVQTTPECWFKHYGRKPLETHIPMMVSNAFQRGGHGRHVLLALGEGSVTGT